MRTKRLIALFLLAFATPVFAEPVPVGRLSYLEGRVDRRLPDGNYAPVAKDDAVSPGDVLRTKSDSRIEISFDDASTVKLGENAQLHLKEYSIDGGKRGSARIQLDRGVMRAIVSKSASGQQNFFIDTPNAGGSVKGSDIGVSYLKSSSTFLAMSGAIEARHAQFPDKAVLIEKGSTAFVPAEAPAQAARPFLTAEAEHFRDTTAPLLARDANATSGDLSKAIVTDVLGDVRIKAKGSDKWHRAALKEILGEGDQVETGDNGGLRMVLESGRIVELGPDTQLTIDQFKVDMRTGSREDLLSSKKGEIRARIDKLKGNSKFQVTTPTAIASVRGTIMYLNISPEITKAFFEAGHGALTNLVNGLEKTVDPGQNSQADNQGNVSDPVKTTPEQHQQLEAKFSAQEQGFRMAAREDSPPVVNKLVDGGGPGGDRGGLRDRAEKNAPTDRDQKTGDILQSVTNRVQVVVQPVVFSGDINNGKFSIYFVEGGTSVTGQNRNAQNFYDAGDIDGSLLGLGSFHGAASSNSPTFVSFFGTYNDGFLPSTQASIWSFETDGFGFKGYSGGAGDAGDAEGFSKFLFISPHVGTGGTRQTGVATGDLEGTYFNSASGSGTFFLSDDFTAANKGSTTIAPDQLTSNLESAPVIHYGNGAGSFGGSGSMTLETFKGTAINIDGQRWGIWRAFAAGDTSAAENNFSISLAGEVDTNTGQTFDSDVVMLGRIQGTWESADRLYGDVDALWISEPDGDAFLEAGTLKGEMHGNASGAYGEWQGAAVGEFNRTTASLQLSQVKNHITSNAAAYGIAEVAAHARNYSFNAGQFNGSVGSINATMNTSFYGTQGTSSTNGLWAAIISGNFTGMPGTVTSWAANLKVGTNPVEGTLTGLSWADGKWVGTVSSNGSAPVTFIGQAGGTYTITSGSDGTFEGAGVGTWQNHP